MAPALLICLLLSQVPAPESLRGPAGEPRVEWRGSEACPGAEVEFERALDGYVGEPAVDDGSVVARARIVDGGGHGLHLQLSIESAVGNEEHDLVGLGCEQLIDQAALLLAGAIDPFVYAGAGRERAIAVVPIQRPTMPIVSSAAPEAGGWTEPAADHVAAPPRLGSRPETKSFGPLVAVDTGSSEPGRRRAIEGSIGVAGTGFVGLFPRIGGGAELEGALERGGFRWQSAATGWFGGRFRASDAEVGGDLWALSFSSGLCGVPGTSRIHVPLCAVGGVGVISVRAIGTVEPRRSTQPWVYAGAEARLSVLARPDLAVGLGVGVHAALVRPAWEVRSPDVRFEIPPVMGIVRLTLEMRGLGRKK